MDWLAELKERAEQGLEWYVRDYFAATAGPTADADWDRIQFRPRSMRGARSLSTGVKVLGTSVSTPVLVAPMAQQVAADRRGEVATAEAARSAGSLLGVSTFTGVRFEDIDAVGAPWWFQIYLLADRELTRRMVQRAARAGASAIILTVDTTALVSSRPGFEPVEWPDTPGKERLVNLTPEERAALGVLMPGPGPSQDDIAWLAEISGGLPVVVKGVLRADDAAAAVDAGASGIIVSTHGGRRMGGSVSSLRALPEVVAAAGTRAEVYVDSGIRSGAHVLAALALGARAVFVGRPALWGLIADGREGVEAVVRRLTAEFVTALDQSGVRGMDDLTPDLIERGGLHR